MGLEISPVSGGCCGLAGSWGFEHGHHEISMQCGEQALLPAVRDADRDTLVIANGFSCKTQIEHARTGRRALHLGQVMRLAASSSGELPARIRPERITPVGRPHPPRWQRAARLAAAGAAAAAAVTGARAAWVRRP
jgi:hypothetical protein